MLTIEEIVKNIKELNSSAKVELECINRNGLLNINKNKAFQEANKELLRNEKLIVTGICIEDGFICINGDDYRLLEKELKYFRIKRPTPTFGDVANEVMQAGKDGLLGLLSICYAPPRINYTVLGNPKEMRVIDDSSSWHDEINKINSLYTKEFTIENNEDIVELLRKDEIELTNGNVLVCRGKAYEVENRWAVDAILKGLTNSSHIDYCLTLTALKGAKVTRKRGDV